MLSINLSGHLSVVTGATGQLGQVMARTMAACGAGVVIHYRQNVEMARQLLSEVHAAGVPGMIVQADVTQKHDVQRMKTEIGKTFGAPDIIINNAVIQYAWANVLEQPPADYEGQFRSCVLHNVLMAQAFVPAMVAKNWGRVIAINTECAMQNFPNQSAYVAGKRGMDGVLRVLAREVGQHQVTVNQVAPGWIMSEAASSHDNDEWYAQQVPLKRRGTAQDVANLVAFLASDLAGFISGQYISVSGANVMPAI
jgi:3-oxoacyl-[acyl-carrier protein] reductase